MSNPRRHPPCLIAVDESVRNNDYYVIAATVATATVAADRAAVKGLATGSQKSFHASKESDSRRKVALEVISGTNIRARLYVCSTKGIREAGARHLCLDRLADDLEGLRCSQVYLEQRDGQDAKDRVTLFGAKRRLTHSFEFSHVAYTSEPLLWASDAIGWAYGRGGNWRVCLDDLNLSPTVIEIDA